MPRALSGRSAQQLGELRWECLLKTGSQFAACFNLANVLAELGHNEAATERYRQVVELDPEYAEAWNNLGLCLAELGELPHE
jgi:Flp pilus assembly protein TadD